MEEAQEEGGGRVPRAAEAPHAGSAAGALKGSTKAGGGAGTSELGSKAPSSGAGGGDWGDDGHGSEESGDAGAWGVPAVLAGSGGEAEADARERRGSSESDSSVGRALSSRNGRGLQELIDGPAEKRLSHLGASHWGARGAGSGQ